MIQRTSPFPPEGTKDRPRVAVSACLLGHPVRYDGGEKFFPVIVEEMAPLLELLPLCPEWESGLPVPREPMRLEDRDRKIRLRSEKGEDHTKRLETWSRRKIKSLKRDDIRGLILKARSPSCGSLDTPIFRNGEEEPAVLGAGIFARMVQESFPELPVIDEERLADTALRQEFLSRVDRDGS